MIGRFIKHDANGDVLYRYAIEYKDDSGDLVTVFTWHCWAYSKCHALEKFYDGPDSDGWVPVRIARMSEKPRTAWRWQRC